MAKYELNSLKQDQNYIHWRQKPNNVVPGTEKKTEFLQILCEKMHIMIFAEVHHSKTNWKIFLMWPSLLVLQKLKIINKMPL